MLETFKALDSLRLNFRPDSLLILNLTNAFIMFGVALNLRPADFINVLKTPRSALTGIISQFVLLPFLTWLLIIIVRPEPSLALGMIMVASCPGGNISNFMTHLAGGNTALSISLTAVSTFGAIVMTPLNLQFWGGLYQPSALLLRTVQVNFFDLFQTIALILAIPLIAGMIFRHYHQTIALRISSWLKPLSMLIFAMFVVVALGSNWHYFLTYIDKVLLLVLMHNALGLLLGFYSAKIAGLNLSDQKTITIETGIQNSGLGLLLIFTFFDGLGGMAIIAAWWGIWHIISGTGLSFFWSRVTVSELREGT